MLLPLTNRIELMAHITYPKMISEVPYYGNESLKCLPPFVCNGQSGTSKSYIEISAHTSIYHMN